MSLFFFTFSQLLRAVRGHLLACFSVIDFASHDNLKESPEAALMTLSPGTGPSTAVLTD